MSKVYTFAAKFAVNGLVVYAHTAGDQGFTKLGKCTTAKRKVEDDLGVSLVNFSYRSVDGSAPVPGQKVYTIQEKVLVGGDPIYVQAGDDVWYPTRKAASKAIRTLRQGWEGMSTELVIYSFKVDTPRVEVREFTVTTTVVATTQEEADTIVSHLLADRNTPQAVVA